MLDHDVKSSDKELMVYCIYTINAANTLDIASVRSIASLNKTKESTWQRLDRDLSSLETVTQSCRCESTARVERTLKPVK